MKIDKLIAILQRVRDKKGNIEVMGNSYCGTNSAHVQFEIEKMKKSFKVENWINGHNEFCLTVKLAEDSRQRQIEGIKDMESKGYTYYRSQFVEKGKRPHTGLSPCDWHGIW